MAEIKIDRGDVSKRVLRVLTQILYGQSKRDKSYNVTEDTDIYDDLGMDSVESLDFLTALEEEFGVNPDQFEANQKRKVKDIVDYVVELLHKQQEKKRSFRR